MWIGGNVRLNLEQMQNNALMFRNNMIAKGWSMNAICAVLGNMQSESTINPNRWEGGVVNPSKGYGLTQWTPSTKLSNWSPQHYTEGDEQCRRIQWEADNNQQWFENPLATPVQPPITFKQFTTSNLDIPTLAKYFVYYYEHPTDPNQPARGTQALYWYEYLTGHPPTPTKTKKMKVWQMCSRIIR